MPADKTDLDKVWEVDDWWEDIEDGVWPYSDAFLEKMKSVPMYGEIWKERQRTRCKRGISDDRRRRR